MKLQELKDRLFQDDPKVEAMYNIRKLYREAERVSLGQPKRLVTVMMDAPTDVYVDCLWEEIASWAKALTNEEYESVMQDLRQEGREEVVVCGG